MIENIGRGSIAGGGRIFRIENYDDKRTTMKTAFVFPGQGSQFVGMGEGFAETYLKKAGDLLGFDLGEICLEGPPEKLSKTEISQPAILTVSYAAFEILRNKGIKPDYIAGHSLGEYSALVAAGSISFEDAVRLVHLRGKFMQEAVPSGQGAMVAVINGTQEKILKFCSEVSNAGIGTVEIANINSPDQIIISGYKKAVEEVSKLCKNEDPKIRVILLAVSVPSHCSLMKPAAERLKLELEKIPIRLPKSPVIANVNAEEESSIDAIRKNLYDQLVRSVLWVDSVNRLISLGVASFIEVGPGKVLGKLIRRINSTVEVKTYVEA